MSFANTYGVELLCLRPATPEKAALLGALRARCPAAEPLDKNAESGLLAFVHPDHPIQLADARIAAQSLIAPSDKPFEIASVASAIEQTWRFEGAGKKVAACTASVLVTDFMSGALHYDARIDLFHRTLRAALDVIPCEAIHWQPAQRIVDPAEWMRAFDAGNLVQLLAGGAINVRMFNVQGPSRKSGEIVMDTLGLSALGLPDLQCHFFGLEPPAVARALYNTAFYVFEHGDVVEDGNTVPGVQPGSKWPVQHEDSLVGPTRVVLDLDPGIGHAAGNRSR